MSTPKIIERTLYPPLVESFKKLGFSSIGEAATGDRKFSDIVFRYKSELYVVEIKIGEPTTTLSLKAMAQAQRYAKKIWNTKFYGYNLS